MNPFNNGFDEFGRPLNIGMYTPEEHIAMQQEMYGVSGSPFGMPMGGVPCQQPMYPNQNFMYQQNRRANTKKDILNYVKNFVCPSEVETVSEFDTVRTRHICRGVKDIVLLAKQVIQVPTTSGVIGVEVFFCPRCRKLLINSQTLELY